MHMKVDGYGMCDLEWSVVIAVCLSQYEKAQEHTAIEDPDGSTGSVNQFLYTAHHNQHTRQTGLCF